METTQRQTTLSIGYNPKTLRINLYVGLIFLVLAAARFIYGEQPPVFQLLPGIAYLGIYWSMKTAGYVSVKDGFIKKHLSSRIGLDEIVEVKYFAGDYTIRSKSKKITIDLNVIDPSQKEQLESFLQGLQPND